MPDVVKLAIQAHLTQSSARGSAEASAPYLMRRAPWCHPEESPPKPGDGCLAAN
jgi:hypothetical protein